MAHYLKLILIFTLLATGCANKPQNTELEDNAATRQNRKSINRVIYQNIKKFQRCYYKHTPRNQPVSGKVTLHFTVLANGKVQRAGVSESELPIALKACLIGVIYKIRFPRTARGGKVKIKQPLRF